MNVQDVLDALLELAPESMKEEWDNVGLLCGRAGSEVSRILVALDPTLAVAEEAKSIGAQMMVTHHPVIFHACETVSDADPVGRTLLFLIENGIAAVNLHTNLDAAPGGVNDCLAAALGLREAAVLLPAGKDAQGREYGLCRYGTVERQSLAAFLTAVRDALRCGGLRYADGGRPVCRVAVGGGACAEFLPDVRRAGCDTFVTADVRYHEFADAAALGVNLIDAGHFPTEDLICPRLAAYLRSRFPQAEVLVSKRHKDVVNFL